MNDEPAAIAIKDFSIKGTEDRFMQKKSNKAYAREIVKNLNMRKVGDGVSVGVLVETKEKGEDIIRIIDAIIPGATERWEFKIILAKDVVS